MLRSERISKAFGRALRRHRKAAQKSQAALAELCNLDRTYISLLERGLRQPSLSVLVALAKAVGVQPKTLLEDALDEQNRGR